MTTIKLTFCDVPKFSVYGIYSLREYIPALGVIEQCRTSIMEPGQLGIGPRVHILPRDWIFVKQDNHSFHGPHVSADRSVLK